VKQLASFTVLNIYLSSSNDYIEFKNKNHSLPKRKNTENHSTAPPPLKNNSNIHLTNEKIKPFFEMKMLWNTKTPFAVYCFYSRFVSSHRTPSPP